MGVLVRGSLLRETQQEQEDPEVRTQSCCHPHSSFQELCLYLTPPLPRFGQRRRWKVGRGCGVALIVFLQPIPTPLLQLLASLVRAVQGQESLWGRQRAGSPHPHPVQVWGLLWVGGQQAPLPVPVGPGPPDASGKVEIKLGTCSRSLVLGCADYLIPGCLDLS